MARSIRLLSVWVLALAVPLAAQLLPLEEASARKGADPSPFHGGKTVQVHGQVAAAAIASGDSALLPIAGGAGHGLLLDGPEFMFEHVSAGDRLDVRGVVGTRDGMVVIRPVQITTLDHSSPPPVPARKIAELQSLRATGLLVSVEGRIASLGETGEGNYLVLDDGHPVLYPVILSRKSESAAPNRFHIGDQVRAVGIAAAVGGAEGQATYRLLAAHPDGVTVLHRGWIVAPHVFVIAGVALLLAVSWRWRRRAVVRSRHRAIRRLNSISEDLLASSSPEELARKLSAGLPDVLGPASVRLFRFDRATQRLETIEEDQAAASRAEECAVGLAFRNRVPLVIADTRRSRLLEEHGDSPGGGMIVVPIQARNELSGVLSLTGPERMTIPSPEELAALQHLGNQAALTLKLIEGAERKEQLLRSEKLAATGQLIHGMAGELRAPLVSIVALANRLGDQGHREARAIVNESLRASAILSRLATVAPGEQEEAQTLDINQAVARALESCRAEWEEVDLSLEVEFHPKPLWVLGSPGQIQQVIRNLVSLAARTAVETRDPSVTLSCGSMARRVAVTIEYPVAASSENYPLPSRADEDGGPLGLEVCRGILQGNGGEMQLSSTRQGYSRIEISFPEAFHAVARASVGAASRGRGSRRLTAVVLEPELAVQKRLVSLLTGSGHRALPVANEAEAVELTGKLRIDALFSAVRVGSTNWVEIFERTRQQVPTFILLTEGLESEESALFPDGEGLVLRKPVDGGDLGRLLERIDERMLAGVTGRS